MIGIEEAATALGLTPRQVYRRISTVRPVLAPYIRRGENNAILLDGSAIEILRAVEDYRQRGETVEEAVRRVDIEINGNGKGERRETCGKPAEGLAEGLFRELLLEKDRTIEVLKEENERLRSEVDRLLPLALPAPRPRRWLFWRRQ